MAQNLFDLTGKVALVTGANSGLGLGYARGLAKAGADVVIWGRRHDRNQLALRELEQHGGRVRAESIDVSSESQVAEGVAKAVKDMGRLDCVIANAGINSMTPFVQLTSRTYSELMRTNLDGAFYTLREAARHMVQRGESGDPGGSLIITGSLSILGGSTGITHYGAAKGALNSMSKSMAVELGPHQIRVNVVAPGLVATEMTEADPNILALVKTFCETRTCNGRVGYPADYEGIIVYLASDMARHHTGDTIIIDGGQTTKLM